MISGVYDKNRSSREIHVVIGGRFFYTMHSHNPNQETCGSTCEWNRISPSQINSSNRPTRYAVFHDIPSTEILSHGIKMNKYWGYLRMHKKSTTPNNFHCRTSFFIAPTASLSNDS